MGFELKKKKLNAYTATSCLFGKKLCKRCVFRTRNTNFAGFGLFANTVIIPAGNDSIISPDILTWHLHIYKTDREREKKTNENSTHNIIEEKKIYLVSSAPRKYEWTISWNATASGMVSAIPIVNGDGPLDTPTGTHAVRNSKLPTLSAREIVAGLMWPLGGPSERRDGGRGIDM